MSSDAESSNFMNSFREFEKSIDQSWEINSNNEHQNTAITKQDLEELQRNIKNDMNAMEQRIIKEMKDFQNFMKKALYRVIKEVETVKNSEKTTHSICSETINLPKIVQIYPKVPFEDIKEFHEFEKSLQSTKKFADLVTQLRHEDVETPIKFIKICWRKIIKDEVAQNLCWRGTDKKLAVYKLKTTAAIKEAYTTKFTVTQDTEFAKTCIYYFQQAKSRCQKRTDYKIYKCSDFVSH